MQPDTAPSEPDLLFSPQPSGKPRSSMTGERDKNSVLFKLDDVARQPAAIPQPIGEESSGLVEIKSLLQDEAPAQTPSAPAAGAAARDSSGLVDLNKLLADEEAAKQQAEPEAPVVPALAPTALVDDAVEAAPASPTIPTWMLVGVIVALAATVGVLVLKLT